jgi:hypothetical protein
VDFRDHAYWLSSPPQPLRLLFSSHDAFIEELRERGPNLEPMVRVTYRKRADGSGAPLTHLTLLATYLRRVDDGTGATPVIIVVQLAEYLGSLWIDLSDHDSQRCQQRAEHLRTTVVRAAEELGLRIGAGAYLVGERDSATGAASG